MRKNKNIFIIFISVSISLFLFSVFIFTYNYFSKLNIADNDINNILSINIGILQALVGIVAIGLPIISYIDREKIQKKFDNLETKYKKLYLELNNMKKTLDTTINEINDRLSIIENYKINQDIANKKEEE